MQTVPFLNFKINQHLITHS